MNAKEKADLLDLLHTVGKSQIEISQLIETMKMQVGSLITEEEIYD